MKRKKLLIIRESHHLPESTLINLNDCEAWYENSTESLSSEDIRYTDTATIISKEDKEPHRIYQNLFGALRKAGIRDKNHHNPFCHVAYNFFQMPASYGKGLKRTDLQDKKAYDVFEEVIKTLQPDLVFIASKKTWHAFLNEYWGTSNRTQAEPLQVNTETKILLCDYIPSIQMSGTGPTRLIQPKRMEKNTSATLSRSMSLKENQKTATCSTFLI